jgi:hypothetical protein
MKVFKHSKVAELKLVPHTGDISDAGTFYKKEIEEIVSAYVDDYLILESRGIVLSI